MNDKVCWKSDKTCFECKERIRQEIIKEIQEICKCRVCKNFTEIAKTDLIKRIIS